MTEVVLGIRFFVLTCSTEGCGMVFGVPHYWDVARREDHKTFYCPNGHTQYFPAESDAEKYKRQLDAAEKMTKSLAERADELRAQRDRQSRRLSSMRGVVTRTKRRIGHGVCPCCKRSFTALREHMKRKHPDYAKCGSEESP